MHRAQVQNGVAVCPPVFGAVCASGEKKSQHCCRMGMRVAENDSETIEINQTDMHDTCKYAQIITRYLNYIYIYNVDLI